MLSLSSPSESIQCETREGHQGLHQKSQVPSVLLKDLTGLESQESDTLFRTLEMMKDFFFFPKPLSAMFVYNGGMEVLDELKKKLYLRYREKRHIHALL